MGRPPGQTPLRARARYLFDRLLARSTAALLGWLAVCCLTVVVPVSALLVWTDPNAPRSLSGRLTSVWRTSAETLRLGQVTGAPLRMLLSVVLGLITLLCVSTVVGVLTTGLGDRLSDLRRGRSTVVERDHAVVLGWSDQIFTVVGELMATGTGGGQGVVTVLADRDAAEMEMTLTAALGVAAGVRLVCRTGAPTDPDALAVVTPGAARAVVVLPADDADGAGDVTVVRVLLALRALFGPDDGPPVVVAVRDGRYVPAARLAAGPRGTVLETDRTTARLLVQAARRPGLSTALRDLLDFSGAEFHVFDVPETVGLTFEEVALRHDACAVGVLRADDSLLLTPPPHTVLARGDRLVAVAHEDGAGPLADFRDHVDTSVMAPLRALPESPSRMLLLGWNRRAPLIVDMLRRTAPSGSVLDVVTCSGTGAEPQPPPPCSEPAARFQVEYRSGDPSDPETLMGLDVFGYDSVIVLGADQGTGSERSDDRILLTLLMLKSREEGAGRVLSVTAETHDPRSRTVAPLGPASDVIVRGELTALLMAQIAHNPALAGVFEEIFATRGGALALRTVCHYVLPGREASFATVVGAALRAGECAIGYRAHASSASRPYDGIRLCPPKDEQRVWGTRDEVLVLTAGQGELADTDLGRHTLPRMRADDRVDDTEGNSPTSVPQG